MCSSGLLIFSISFLTIFYSCQSSLSRDQYDDATFTSFVSSIDMPYAMSDMVGTTFSEDLFNSNEFNDGARVYLTGGCLSEQLCNYGEPDNTLYCNCLNYTNKMIYFTPETEKYHTNVSEMLRPRYRHMAARMGIFLYVAGGRTVPNDTIITEIDRYNVLTDTWEFVTDWSDATSDGVAFVVHDLLFLVGGYDIAYNSQNTVTALNTTSNEWISFPAMAYPRGDMQIAALNENEFYVIGGWNSNSTGSFCIPQKIVEYYNYNENKWHTVQEMFYARGDLAAGVLENEIFAVGGEQKESGDITCSRSVPVPLVERYLPTLNNWTSEESIPDDLFRFTGVACNSSSSKFDAAIFLFGGQSTFNAATMTYPIRNTTIIYYPSAIYGGKKQKKVLTSGGIAGIVIAGVVVLIAIAAIIIYCGYRYSMHRYYNLNDDDPAGTVSIQMTASSGKGKDASKTTDIIKSLEDEEFEENFGSSSRV